MAGKRHRSHFRKTGKGKEFSGVTLYAKLVEEPVLEEGEIARSKAQIPHESHKELLETSDMEGSDMELDQPESASRKKMKLHNSENDSSESSERETETNKTKLVEAEDGYRLVNLSSVLSNVYRCEGEQSNMKRLGQFI